MAAWWIRYTYTFSFFVFIYWITFLDNTDEVLIERAKLMNKSYMKNKIKVVK